MTTTYFFLRGINVGGNNLIKMAELRDIASDLGWENPRTLLQSGNLVAEAPASSDVGSELSKVLLERKQMKVAVLVRTRSELDSVIAKNPFKEEAERDPSHLLVLFMASEPPTELVESVQKAIVGPERIHAFGNHLYMVYPDGIGDSKVGKTPGWNELTKGGTARNWNTILKLTNL